MMHKSKFEKNQFKAEVEDNFFCSFLLQEFADTKEAGNLHQCTSLLQGPSKGEGNHLTLTGNPKAQYNTPPLYLSSLPLVF